MTAHITPLRTAVETQFIDDFRAMKDALPGNAAVAMRREQAFADFTRAGLPTRRNEAWHYTDLRAMMRDVVPWARRPDAASVKGTMARLAAVLAADAVRLVLIDGFFIPEASDLDALPPGVRVSSLAAVLAGARADFVQRLGVLEIAAADAAFALNTAFMRDGIAVEIAAGTSVARSLCIISLHTGVRAASTSRSVVSVGENASVSVVELHEGGSGEPGRSNDALEFFIADGARVEHAAMQRLAAGALSIVTLTADLGTHATLNSFALTTGAAVSRRQWFVRCSGAHATAHLSGVSLLGGRQHADTTLVVDHAAPAGESREKFKYIIDDDATGVFQGKVIVRRGAQKTDGGMKSNALLLSDGAAMNNKPELEIFADDVICGHGATCGTLDEDHLFYLMARGLPRQEAEALLLEAFANDAIESVGDAGLREALLRSVQDWLSARTAAGPLSGGEPLGPAERGMQGNLDRSDS
jgi:Fe-S cluster assembly protein SufD